MVCKIDDENQVHFLSYRGTMGTAPVEDVIEGKVKLPFMTALRKAVIEILSHAQVRSV